MIDVHKIAPFFDGWAETLIWSCLQGLMGYAVADNDEKPSSALITVGDFCFLAGTPNHALAMQAMAPIIVPRNEEWCEAVESALGNQVNKGLRYAIKKEPHVFDISKLTNYINALPDTCELKLFDKEIYEHSFEEKWSKDFCSQFTDYSDYNQRGLGVAAICRGELVSGASSYTVYNGGIEIEIDTKPEFRNQGLAAGCGAKLILECLSRGLYPSWDACDLRSVALAEKLGYHMDFPYMVYIRK